jgi:predicted O-methyltransferase YrrM
VNFKTTKIGKTLKALGLIVKRPVLLNKVLSEPDVWKEYVMEKYNIPVGLQVVTLEQITGKKEFGLEPLTFLDGSSLPTDLALLTGLAAIINNCSYFEIGTWRGESAANLARIAGECFTLCLTEEEMKKRGMDEKSIRMHGMFSENLPNVKQLKGDSRDFDFSSLNRKIDLIFIDGDHHYDFVVQDTRKVFEHLVHEKSIVVWHDYGFHPEEVRFEVLAAILDGTDKKLHSRIYHVAHTKCAVLLNQNVESKDPLFPVDPYEYYNLWITNIKLNK